MEDEGLPEGGGSEREAMGEGVRGVDLQLPDSPVSQRSAAWGRDGSCSNSARGQMAPGPPR